MTGVMFGRVTLTAVLAMGASLTAAAQGGTGEIAAGGGMASYNGSGPGSTKGKFAASIGWNAADDFAFSFEYAYSPLAISTGAGVAGSANMKTFGGVGRVSLFGEHRARPYFLFTAGGAIYSASGSATSGSATASTNEGGTFIGLGGGANIRLGGGFGVRPEVRYERMDISNALNDVDITGSLYYTFGKRH